MRSICADEIYVCTCQDNGYDLVVDKSLIARRYLRFWFWADILATFPWDVAILAVWPSLQEAQWTIRMIRMLRVLRLLRASRIIQRMTASWTVHTTYIEAAKFFIYATVVAHLLGCML